MNQFAGTHFFAYLVIIGQRCVIEEHSRFFTRLSLEAATLEATAWATQFADRRPHTLVVFEHGRGRIVAKLNTAEG